MIYCYVFVAVVIVLFSLLRCQLFIFDLSFCLLKTYRPPDLFHYIATKKTTKNPVVTALLLALNVVAKSIISLCFTRCIMSKIFYMCMNQCFEFAEHLTVARERMKQSFKLPGILSKCTHYIKCVFTTAKQ